MYVFNNLVCMYSLNNKMYCGFVYLYSYIIIKFVSSYVYIRYKKITNNAVEGFHSALRSSIICKHPNIWKLIAALKKEELQQTKIIHVNSGDAPARKKIYKSIDRQLKTLVNTYDSSNKI